MNMELPELQKKEKMSQQQFDRLAVFAVQAVVCFAVSFAALAWWMR